MNSRGGPITFNCGLFERSVKCRSIPELLHQKQTKARKKRRLVVPTCRRYGIAKVRICALALILLPTHREVTPLRPRAVSIAASKSPPRRDRQRAQICPSGLTRYIAAGAAS